jgi:hypothetical protein
MDTKSNHTAYVPIAAAGKAVTVKSSAVVAAAAAAATSKALNAIQQTVLKAQQLMQQGEVAEAQRLMQGTTLQPTLRGVHHHQQ